MKEIDCLIHLRQGRKLTFAKCHMWVKIATLQKNCNLRMTALDALFADSLLQ